MAANKIDGAAAPGLAAPQSANYAILDHALVCATAAHAVVTPTSEKAPDAANVGGPVQTEKNRHIFQQSSIDGKWLSTLRAQLALTGGFTLLKLADGSHLVTRWNCSRPLADLHAVAAFLRQVRGAA
jgi:hypothetical protein